MWWDRIASWFFEQREKKRCINNFNNSAKQAFIMNTVPVYMKAEISMGNSQYRHSMSSLLFSGFRIKTVSGRFLTNEEINAIGMTIRSNDELMRKLVTLGFDTLEIYNPNGYKVKDWQLTSCLRLQ